MCLALLKTLFCKKEQKVKDMVDWVLKLQLERYYLGEVDTVGKLYAIYPETPDKKEFICYILEDKVRNGPEVPVDLFEKVYAETAIPYGEYQVIMSYSPRFKKQLPELLDVPHYTGVRIHGGNQATSSEGCLLTGDSPKLSSKGSWISNSQVNLKKVLGILESKVVEGKVILKIIDEVK